MSLWVIELDDVAVRVSRDGELIDSSPGIAVIDGKCVITGTAAAALEHLAPRAAYDRFWQQLSEAPLAGATRQCRHHADLAYHHLAAILHRCGQPAEAVICVPAHYGETELALLLGIAGALKLKVAALVDHNVAALSAGAAPGRYALAELYQHHLTVTTLEVDHQVVRTQVNVIDACGLKRIQRACIDLIADAFLEQSRFDALHEAATEQLLYDKLAAWLDQAGHGKVPDISIDFRGSRHSARIDIGDLERIVAMVIAPLRDRLPVDQALILSARLAALPGCRPLLQAAAVLDDKAAVAGIAAHRLALGAVESGVAYATRLPASNKPTLVATNPRPDHIIAVAAATHLLCGAHAHPITQQPLHLDASSGLSCSGDAAALPQVVLLDGTVLLRCAPDSARVNGAPADPLQRLHCGDVITLAEGSIAFTAINVSDRSAP